ncbi:hypothetical protein HZS_3508 [Henneguya salminicola]|nr:hypothetical protein HZS_3508 [Henneguya salminicola]
MHKKYRENSWLYKCAIFWHQKFLYLITSHINPIEAKLVNFNFQLYQDLCKSQTAIFFYLNPFLKL